MKKTVSIYFRNHTINPSNYYRIYQYLDDDLIDFKINDSAPNGIYNLSLNSPNNIIRLFMKCILYPIMAFKVINSLIEDISNKPNYIIIQREVMPRYILLLQIFLLYKCASKSKIIWDFDDDIFESNEISKKERNFLVKRSYKIIVISEYLKSLLPVEMGDRIICMPTTDGQIFKHISDADVENRIKIIKNEIHLVWVGTSGGLRYVKNIMPALDKSANYFNKKGIKLKFFCVSGTALDYDAKVLEIVNIKWSRNNLTETLKMAHFGIMPLLYENYSFGKGGFKLLQYMSAKIPVLGSNIGFNKEIIRDSFGMLVNDEDDIFNWSEAIQIMCKKNYYNLSSNAYASWLENYSFEKNKTIWNNLLNE